MQGFASKSAIAAIIFTAALSNSFATDVKLAMQNHNHTMAAGCMGCHQGETETMRVDETADNQTQDSKKTDTQHK